MAGNDPQPRRSVVPPPPRHADGGWHVKVERAKAARSSAQATRTGKPTAFTTRRSPSK